MNIKFVKKSSLFGAPSIALILMATGLTIFSLLALRSSINEQKMAKKAATASKTYYELSGKIETALAEIDEQCLLSDKSEYEKIILSVPCVECVEKMENEEGKGSYVITLYTSSETYENMGFEAVVFYDPISGRTDIKEWKAVHEQDTEGVDFIF